MILAEMLSARRERKMGDYKLVPVEKVRELIREAHYEGQASATGREPSHFRWANSQACRNADAILADAPDVQGKPVAVVDADDDGMWADILPDVTVKVGQTLYTAPQPSFQLPDFATDPDDSDEGASLWDHGFKRGWNSCLKVVAKAMQSAEQQPAPDVSALVEALEELIDLMEDTRQGEYIPDSFTTQPARIALAAHRKGGEV